MIFILNITDPEISEFLSICEFYSYPKKYDASKAIDNLKKEGYILSDHAEQIIKELGGIMIGPQGTKIVNGHLEYASFPHLTKMFMIDPCEIRDERDRLKYAGEIVSDDLVPLGIYSGDYLTIGSSGKIYIIAANGHISLLGNDLEDFLKRYYANSEPLLTIKL